MTRFGWSALVLWASLGTLWAEDLPPQDTDWWNDPLARAEVLSLTHQVLGYTTLIVGAVAVGDQYLGGPGGGHGWVGLGAAGVAAVTLIDGYFTHYERLPLNNLDKGLFTFDNFHVVLGILGAGMLVAAPFFEPTSVAHQVFLDGGAGALGAAVLFELK